MVKTTNCSALPTWKQVLGASWSGSRTMHINILQIFFALNRGFQVDAEQFLAEWLPGNSQPGNSQVIRREFTLLIYL